MRLGLLLLLLSSASPPEPSIGPARSEMAPRPFIVSPACPWAEYYFKMSTDPAAPLSREKGLGFAYKLRVGERDELLWKTEGWFADYVFLAGNGLDLVRIGRVQPRGRPSPDDIAVAFYHQGVLVKSYSTADLVNQEAGFASSDDPYWFVRVPTVALFDLGGQEVVAGLRLTTVDDVEHLFRVSDGSIITPETK